MADVNAIKSKGQRSLFRGPIFFPVTRTDLYLPLFFQLKVLRTLPKLHPYLQWRQKSKGGREGGGKRGREGGGERGREGGGERGRERETKGEGESEGEKESKIERKEEGKEGGRGGEIRGR